MVSLSENQIDLAVKLKINHRESLAFKVPNGKNSLEASVS
jgi:hypothetical protein